MAHLSNVTATSSHVEHYANIIQRKATLRRLLNASSEISELGYNESDDIDEILDKAERKLFGVSQKYLKKCFPAG